MRCTQGWVIAHHFILGLKKTEQVISTKKNIPSIRQVPIVELITESKPSRYLGLTLDSNNNFFQQ